MVALLGAAAWGGIQVVAVRDPLVPGHPAVLEIAATEATGQPVAAPPDLTLVGATGEAMLRVRPGVWHWMVVPAPGAERVEVRGPSEWSTGFDVALPDPGRVPVPSRLDATTRQERVPVRISGPDLPPLEALEIMVGEGEVVDLERTADAIVFQVAPSTSGLPRVIPVGVRDRRTQDLPAWSRIHVRGRELVTVDVEQGATLTLKVTDRVYGPWVAGPSGRVEARIDQYPGETIALARITDDLGNEHLADVLLGGAADASLLLFPEGPWVPGLPPPRLHLYGITAGGGPVRGTPDCRTPSATLTTVPSGPGSWLVALPWPTLPDDVRVICTLEGSNARASARVPLAPGVPQRLEVRVSPEDLRTDFPVAEIRAALEDARGERLPASDVELSATLGRITVIPGAGDLLRGEYDGQPAVIAGSDTVTAAYRAPPGNGPVQALVLGWGAVPGTAGGPLRLYARAVDGVGRPLAGVRVSVSLADLRSAPISASGLTETGGWWIHDLVVPRGFEALEVAIGAGPWTVRGLLVRSEGAHGGPDVPDLEDDVVVRLRAGQIAGIRLQVDPPVLSTGPGATARIHVELQDASGRAVVDQPIRLFASEGDIGVITPRPDGTLVADYVPEPVSDRRVVEITAQTDALRSSTRLVLEPRSVRVSVGPWMGVQTNFGAVTGAVGGVELDLRARIAGLGDAVMFRVGGQAGAFRNVVETGGAVVELRSVLIPAALSVLLRDDRGPWAVWLGGGASLAAHRLVVRIGQETATAEVRALAGPTLQAGVSRRAAGGEVVLTSRFSWLSSAGGGEIGYTGNLGGLAVGLGYRLVY